MRTWTREQVAASAAAAAAASAVGADAATPPPQCIVIYKGRVYDVMAFAADHPGGDDILLEHAGQDISDVLHDAALHAHSSAALDVLAEYCVGVLVEHPSPVCGHAGGTTPEGTAGGRALSPDLADSAIDLASSPSSPSSPSLPAKSASASPERLALPRSADAARRDQLQRGEVEYAPDVAEAPLLARKDTSFLDLTRPLFTQVLFARNMSKRHYMEQVHIPRHTRGSAPIFGGLLEPLTKTPWWVVPLAWLPFVAYLAAQALHAGLSGLGLAVWFIAGVVAWTLLEYTIHRFVFHADGVLPDHPAALALHFIVHGVHHFLPMDRMRLVLPPALFVILATPIISFFFAILPFAIGRAMVAGAVFGYICYDMTHYYLHHGRVITPHLRDMKTYHLEHHYREADLGFGITSKLWDKVFHTELVTNETKKRQ